MKKKFGSRMLSIFLAGAMIFTNFGFMTPEALAEVVEYATPATQAELNDVARWFTADNGAYAKGSYAKVINGTVYVWGANTGGILGITEYVDANGETVPVASGTNVPVPTAIPKTAFNNENVVKIQMSYNTTVALTDKNNVYAWGTRPSAGFTPCMTPSLIDTTAIHSKGRTIESINAAGQIFYMIDDQGGVYVCGNGAGIMLGTEKSKTATNVAEPILPALQTAVGKAVMVAGMHFETSYILNDKGHLFAFGRSKCNEIPVETTADEATDLNTVVEEWASLKFTYLFAEDQAALVVDQNGDVWAWGRNNSDRFGSLANGYERIDANNKVFDHNVFQKKATRAWLSFNRLVVLCDDNTVYAQGDNSNGVIVPGGGASVPAMTQILFDVSQSSTIVGVFPANNSQMAITKSGDMIFAGSNENGGAGDGTTISKPAGTTTTVTSSTMPPSAPLTKNAVSYELEIIEDGKTVYYRPVASGNGTKYTKIVGNSSATTVENITVDAGTTFKLNVFFEDFGKINTFVMPIRFNPKHLEVVNGNGKAYSRNSEVVTPGAIGASVGIEQKFTVKDWNGGSLAVGTTTNTYPKISNSDGWVSVAGYSADPKPVIDGKVKMFSISFRARETVKDNGIAFDFATSENVPSGTGITILGSGYDVTANGLPNGKAYWSLYNASNEGGESGYYEFNSEPFPLFSSKLVMLNSLGMSLTYGAANNPIELNEAEDAAFNPSWTINWSNTSVTYKLTADPYHMDGSKKVPGASFPQVNWSFDSEYVPDPTNRDRTWADYITIIDTQDTYVTFKVNPDFKPITNEASGWIKVTATSQQYPSISTTYHLCLKNFAAPATLELAQKDSDGNLVQLGDGQEMIYHYRSDENEDRVFWVDFGGAPENKEVVWSLLDKNGDPIDISDPDAKVTFRRNDDGSVTIDPHYTTAGDDYLILHVESLYDSNKFDEVKIKIHLYATNLGFKPDVVRMAVMKDGVPSTIDLSPYLQVQPIDVYDTNYTWAIVGTPSREPSNAKDDEGNYVDGFTPGMTVNYGTLGSGSTAATFTAFEWATPAADSDNDLEEEFVTVRVTETLSGKTADIKIAIMDLNSPIGIDQFVATNNLGFVNDTVMVKGGLQLGDIITFYETYEKALNGMPYGGSATIVEGMYPYFTFVVGNRDGSLMSGAGGFLAVQITRTDSATGMTTTYDPVPVSYSAEPSLVDGYAHLFGKNTGSVADKDIRIDLEGLNFKETVYTDSSGYFKFTKYIAPGIYNMVVSKQNYLTRRMEPNSSGVGGLTIQVNDDGEFHISTYNQPIILFPGELTNDNAINVQDINYYVSRWVGQYDGNITDFDAYDFFEDNVISLKDLELLLMRKDWVSGSYPIWSVPEQR